MLTKFCSKPLMTFTCYQCRIIMPKLSPLPSYLGWGNLRLWTRLLWSGFSSPYVYVNISTFAPAYPPMDEVVHNHLNLVPDEIGCKQYLKLFLSSLFTLAHHQAQELFPGHKIGSYTWMVMVFYDFFANPLYRNGFYEIVVTKAQNSPYIKVWEYFEKLKNYLEGCCSK